MNRKKSVITNEYVWYATDDKELTIDLRGVDDIKGVLAIEEWNDSIIEFIKSNRVEGLWIRGNKFYTTELSLAFLKELPWLKYLKIDGKFKKTEYKAVEFLKNLESLSFGDHEAFEIDFSNMKNLKSYFSPIKHSSHPILCSETIEYLGTVTNLETFAPFSALINLKELYIMAKKMKNLSGIEALRNLRSLAIDYGRNIESFSLLEKLDILEKLSLYGCNKLARLDHVSKIKNLKCLWFDGCGKVESLNPIVESSSIEFISFGDTIIEDGDIECLTKIRSLKGVYFRNKKFYNMKYDDFKGYDYKCI